MQPEKLAANEFFKNVNSMGFMHDICKSVYIQDHCIKTRTMAEGEEVKTKPWHRSVWSDFS